MLGVRDLFVLMIHQKIQKVILFQMSQMDKQNTDIEVIVSFADLERDIG